MKSKQTRKKVSQVVDWVITTTTTTLAEKNLQKQNKTNFIKITQTHTQTNKQETKNTNTCIYSVNS